MAKLTKKQRKVRSRILLAAALLILIKLLPMKGWAQAVLFLIPYLLIGYDVLRKAVLGIVHGQVFDENFLMALATVGAFATGEYAEAVFVMLFYQTGELFQDYAVGKSRASIAALMDIRPDTANLETESGLDEVDPEDVPVGAVIVVKPGERVPLDGIVLEGSSTLDTAALTGESLPRDIAAGAEITSGCVNLTGLLRVRVTKPCAESTVSKILELVENSSEKKAVSEQFITRFAKYYTPCVVCAALALFLIPTLLLAVMPAPPAFLTGTVWTEWLHRALIFLVISCPCALVISVPLSFFGGIGGASRNGILVKGGNYLEALAKVDTMVFDKTGTLTQGHFTVQTISPAAGLSEQALLEAAALAESYSSHPISQSLQAAAGALDTTRVTDVAEQAGFGVTAHVDGQPVAVGSARLMAQLGLQVPAASGTGTLVHVAIGGAYAGSIRIADQLKPDAAAITQLKALGIRKAVMLTGDTEAAAQEAAQALGLDEFHAQLLPDQKVSRVEAYLAQTRGNVAFVGDGLNDAPVLTRADVGIAMGGLGSDAAIEAADVVLMDDRLQKLPAAIRIARKTVRIVRENIVFALAVKGSVLVMGAFGSVPMWLAVFADVGVAFIAILNAMRCLHTDQT